MAEREEEQGWEAGEAERADEEFLAAIAEWSGTPSSNKILLTMLASTRLRNMSNVIPKDQTAGPVHGWSICTLVEQAETTVSDRETGAMRKVSISSLTASTLPSRTSDQNDQAFDDAKQEMSIAKSGWHRASKSMCPGPVFQNVSSRNDTTRLLYQPVREKYPLLKDRPNRSQIHQKLQEAQLHGIDSFAPLAQCHTWYGKRQRPQVSLSLSLSISLSHTNTLSLSLCLSFPSRALSLSPSIPLFIPLYTCV